MKDAVTHTSIQAHKGLLKNKRNFKIIEAVNVKLELNLNKQTEDTDHDEDDDEH
jgi:hypothetical protein